MYIKEFIENNKKLIKKISLILLGVFIGIPIFIDVFVFWDDGLFNTSFTPQDILNYFGSFLAFTGTVALGGIALWQNNNIHKSNLEFAVNNIKPTFESIFYENDHDFSEFKLKNIGNGNAYNLYVLIEICSINDFEEGLCNDYLSEYNSHFVGDNNCKQIEKNKSKRFSYPDLLDFKDDEFIIKVNILYENSIGHTFQDIIYLENAMHINREIEYSSAKIKDSELNGVRSNFDI